MPEQISDIIDVTGIHSDIGKVINDISMLEDKITEASGKILTVQVDLRGAESLTQLTEATNEYKKAAADLGMVQQEQAGIMQKYGQVTIGNVQSLVQQKLELGYVNEQIRLLNKELATGTGDIQKNTQYLENLTTRQIELKNEINQTSRALKDVSVNVNQTNQAFTVMGVNAESVLARMTVRMIALNLLFLPAIAAISALGEMFTKLSDAEQLAKDKLDGYNESFKQSQKISSEMEGKISAGQAFDLDKGNAALKIANDTTKTIQERVLAYGDLQSAIPNVFKSLTDEQKKTGAFLADADKLNEAARVQNEYKQTALTLQAKDNALAANRAALPQFEKEANESRDPNNAKNLLPEKYQNAYVKAQQEQLQLVKEQKTAQDAYNKSYAEYNALQVIDEKQKKPKSQRRGMNNDIKDEQENYKLVLAKNQERYDANKNNLLREDNLMKENEQALKNHVERLNEIAIDWKNKGVLNGEELLTAQKKNQTELINGENKYTEETQQLADERKKQGEQMLLEIQAHNAKLLEQYEKIRQAKAQMDSAIAEQAKYHKKAGGIGAFIGNNDLTDTEDDIDRQTTLEQGNKAGAQGLLDNAHATSNTDDIAKYSQHVQEAQDNIDKLQLDKQKAQDDAIMQGKKELAEQSIQLAQTTMSAINTIRDNAFAKERMQLEIQMRSVQLQSQQQIQAINASVGYQIQKENEASLVVAQTTAKENQIQQEQNNLALKKAIADKKAAEMEIELNTAIAITKTLPMLSNPVTAAIGIAEIALITAMGAAQYAAAASTPLPQFEDGGVTSTQYFIAAEKNKPELIVSPSGKSMLATKEGIYSAPIGSTVKNASETEKLIQYAINGIGFNNASLAGLQEKREDAMNDKRIVEKLDDIEGRLVESMMLRPVIKNNINVNTRNPLQRYS